MAEELERRFTKLKIVVGAILFVLELGVHAYLIQTTGSGIDPWLLALPFVLMGVDSSLVNFKK